MAATASALMACSLLKRPGAVDGGEDGASEASAVAAPEAAAVDAVNQSEMTRYPDEKPIDHAPLTAESGGAMRTQAGPGGDLVIVLKKGTEVEKVAEHEGYYLVLAEDPKDPTRKLMGWIAESAFSGGGGGGGGPFHNRTEPEPRADGGAAPHVDAGTKPTPPPGPVKPLDVHKTNGTCPAGYGSCAAVCRMTCKADGDCGVATAHCTAGFCMGPGAAPCK